MNFLVGNSFVMVIGISTTSGISEYPVVETWHKHYYSKNCKNNCSCMIDPVCGMEIHSRLNTNQLHLNLYPAVVSARVGCSILSHCNPTGCISLNRNWCTYLHHRRIIRDAPLRCDIPQSRKWSWKLKEEFLTLGIACIYSAALWQRRKIAGGKVIENVF